MGQIEHHGATYLGQHKAIIDAKTWDAVQALLKGKAPPRRSDTNSTGQHILTGLVFDETGDRLSPTHANKRGKRYRYYISHPLMEAHRAEKDGWRLPASALEQAVLAGLTQLLSNKVRVIDLIQLGDASPRQIRSINGEIERAKNLLNDGSSAEQQVLLSRFLARIDLEPGRLRITLDLPKLHLLLLERQSDGRALRDAEFSQSLRVLALPFALRRRGVETKMIINDRVELERKLDIALIGLVAKAYRWFDLLSAGKGVSMEGLASSENADVNEMSRILQLAFLAPEIVEMIVIGEQPVDLTLMTLKRISYLPFGWTHQRASLQF